MTAVALSVGAKMFQYVSNRFGIEVFPANWPSLLSLREVTLKEVGAFLMLWEGQREKVDRMTSWSLARLQFGELVGNSVPTSSGACWLFSVVDNAEVNRWKPLHLQLWGPRRRDDNWQPYPSLDLESDGDGCFRIAGWVAKQSKRAAAAPEVSANQLLESWIFGLCRSHEAMMQLKAEILDASRTGRASASDLVVALSNEEQGVSLPNSSSTAEKPIPVRSYKK